MYAIVKTGGKQYKVAEGDVIEVEKVDAGLGDQVSLAPVLLVDGESVTHEADKLSATVVTAEVVALTKGPKIRIHKFKNKTGYHKRQGHRQKLMQLKVTGIGGSSSAGPAKKATAKKAAKKAPAKKTAASAESATASTTE